MSGTVVWLKRDLRLDDHAPLAEALAIGEPVLLVYIVEPILLNNAHYRGRHWHFIAQSLDDINQSKACTLWCRGGDSRRVSAGAARDPAQDFSFPTIIKLRRDGTRSNLRARP